MIDKLLLEHVGLPHVLDLAVHLVNFFGWMSQGGHSEPLLQLALFYQSTPSCLKVIGGVGGILVSAPVPWIGDLGLGDWGLGLDNFIKSSKVCSKQDYQREVLKNLTYTSTIA